MQPDVAGEEVCEAILGLSDAELQIFPLGIARLDLAGNVLFFNQAEEIFANRRAEDTVGLNYFNEVAPCTAVKSFQGRFIELCNGPMSGTDSFSFTYPFWMGDKRVTINLIRRSQDSDYVYIVTQTWDEA